MMIDVIYAVSCDSSIYVTDGANSYRTGFTFEYTVKIGSSTFAILGDIVSMNTLDPDCHCQLLSYVIHRWRYATLIVNVAYDSLGALMGQVLWHCNGIIYS